MKELSCFGVYTGDMLLPVATEMLPDESCGSLHDRLAVIGGEAIVKALDLLEKGQLKPVIHAVLPMEQAEQAHAILAKGGHIGKVVLEVS